MNDPVFKSSNARGLPGGGGGGLVWMLQFLFWCNFELKIVGAAYIAGVETFLCVVTKQTFVIELRLLSVQTSTSLLPLWTSAVKTTVVSRKN